MSAIDIGNLTAAIEADLAATAQTVPALRQLRRRYSLQIGDAPGDSVLALALRLLRAPSVYVRFIAYELIYKHREASSRLDAKALARLGDSIDSWAAVDCFACYLSGPAWRAGQVSDSLIQKWACSADRWWRRAALVSTVPLNAKAPGDARRTLCICAMLIDDRDDMVVKAMSWALRKLSQRDSRAVVEFLSKHKSRLAARVVREVGNKLRTGKKNPKNH
jgi:3-methyladenine DNA glycosylase AlkD